jgi:cyanophycinase-like exopeptidase
MKPDCRILAIMGSGETSPTMVTVHKALVDRLGGTHPDAILLDTPYAFQENAADISSRAVSYFATSVGLDVAVVASSDADVCEDGGRAGSGSGVRPGSSAARAAAASIRAAGWVFAGPGSPSYALSRWRDAPLGQALRERIAIGSGVTVLASAAAATAGLAAVPVYEIYKVGAPPHWLPGLDLLAAADLRVALIPHYDNAEGGTHDTRYCYLGERRLAVMERELPADAAVLGVDEHTALIFDLLAETAEVRGRGGLTIRKNGVSTVLAAPAVLPIADLRATIRTGALTTTPAAPAAPVPGRREPDAALPLPDIVARAEQQFEAALAVGDGTGLIMTILDLEQAVHAWLADTDEDQGTEQARAVLRGMISRLGGAVTEGLRDPVTKLSPAVGPLVELRSSLRTQGRYEESDAIRAALAACGVQIADGADGTRWAIVT